GRLGGADIGAEFPRRLAVTAATLSEEATGLRGLVGTDPGKGAVSLVEVERGPDGSIEKVHNENMHLTLLVRTGLIGWALIMWVIGAALTGIYRGSAAVSDRRLALTLWPIFSSGLGFLISMSNFTPLYNPTIQIMFSPPLRLGT